MPRSEASKEYNRKAQRARYAANPDKMSKAVLQSQRKNPQKYRAIHIKNKYGLEWDDYVALYDAQHGSCAICKKFLFLHQEFGVPAKRQVAIVDHCHTTGQVRGLLCDHCNVALGMLKDNPLLCRLAAEYLEKEDK